MALLDGTPYLLEGSHASTIMSHVNKMMDRVGLLRRKGTLDEPTLTSLRREWNVEMIYESAGIEGNQLTLQETRVAIARGITITGKPPEHVAEVVQLREAHDYLETLVAASNPLTKRELLDIHTLVLGRGERDAGAYRTIEVEIGNQAHKPPHPLKVPEMMEDFFDWLERASSHPAPLRATVAHAWLAHIHPFRDGNGRTARAVMNLILMRAGFPVVIVRRKDRVRYYDALAQSDDGDIGFLLELIMVRAEDSLKQIDRVRHAATGISLEMERIAAAEERQVAVWNAAIGLLCEELAEAFQRIVDNDDAFLFDSQRYEPLDAADYRALCNKQAISQSWLARYRLSRGATEFQMLLWAGFASDDFPKSHQRPAVFVSERNPEGYPQWRWPSEDFASTVREIAYLEGRFVVRRQGSQPEPEASTTEFAVNLVKEVLRNTF